jgi:di-N-acetylchitobiase
VEQDHSHRLQGVEDFLALGLDAQNLVLGVPWYGYIYTCLSPLPNERCPIAEVPFRGVNCSDAAGYEVALSTLNELLFLNS